MFCTAEPFLLLSPRASSRFTTSRALYTFDFVKQIVLKLSRFIEVHNLDGPRYVLHCKNNGLVTSRVSGTRGFILLKGESRGSLGEVAHATRSTQNFSPGPVPKHPRPSAANMPDPVEPPQRSRGPQILPPEEFRVHPIYEILKKSLPVIREPKKLGSK